MCGCARRIQGVLVVFHVDGGGLPEVVGGRGGFEGGVESGGGVGGLETGRGGAASDYESLRPVERWPVGELVLSILSDAEERFQAFLVIIHSAIYTCSQFNNNLYYYQITKPNKGTSLRVM